MQGAHFNKVVVVLHCGLRAAVEVWGGLRHLENHVLLGVRCQQVVYASLMRFWSGRGLELMARKEFLRHLWYKK